MVDSGTFCDVTILDHRTVLLLLDWKNQAFDKNTPYDGNNYF